MHISGHRLMLAVAALAVAGCQTNVSEPGLTVAAASNLTEACKDLGEDFSRQTKIRVTFSYGATAQLAHQIASGAPFDIFVAADTEHVDTLVRSGHIILGSRAQYARGQLSVWVPRGEALGIRTISDLVGPSVRAIAIASPGTAPYGAAAVEALKRSGIWEKLEAKVVYANSISAAKQIAALGNAEAAFTANSLLLKERGVVIPVSEHLHAPLDQALGILATSNRQPAARQFTSFILGGRGRKILLRYGYGLSPE